MSKIKKMVGVLLAVMMVCVMGVIATADTGTTYTITIKYSESNHVYEAYQILTGDLYEEYALYEGTGAPTDGTQLYTYDGQTYTAASYADDGTTFYFVSGTVLSNVQWGSGIGGDALLEALQKDTTVIGKDGDDKDITVAGLFKDLTTAAQVAEVLSDNANNTTLAEIFAQLANENLTTTVAGTSTEKESPYTITSLSAGYYLVKDKDGSVTMEGDSYTDIILKVVSNVTVTAKADTVTIDKTVGSTTDTTGKTTADYDIGDDVPFTLAATIPDNIDDYDTYLMTFHDTLSSGLSFNSDTVEVTVYTSYKGLTGWDSGTTYYTYDSTKKEYVEVEDISTAPDSSQTYFTITTVSTGYSVVYYHYSEANISEFAEGTTYYTYDGSTYTAVVDGAAYVSDNAYYVMTAGCEDGCSFEVQIADVNKLYAEGASTPIAITENSVIVVTYTAKLTADAETTEDNTAYLEYSNNPNDDGTGTTEKDKVTVITFTLDVDKLDEDEYPLTGAGFTLCKEVSVSSFDPDTTYYTYTDGKMTEVDTEKTTAPESGTTYYVAVGDEKTAKYQYQKVSVTKFETEVDYYTYVKDENKYVEVDTTSVTEPADGTDYYIYVNNDFVFEGLAIGSYVLVETTTPAGYNTMTPIFFKVEAVTAETADETGYINVLTITDLDGKALAGESGSTFSLGTITVGETTTYDGTISTDIVNYRGSVLPSTGGIGTVIFRVVGAILVIGAAALLIIRRRLSRAR